MTQASNRAAQQRTSPSRTLFVFLSLLAVMATVVLFYSTVTDAHTEIERKLAQPAVAPLHELTREADVGKAAPMDDKPRNQLNALGYIE